MNNENKEAFDANFQDLKIGDKIVIIHNEDQDLDDWYNEENNEKSILTIETIEVESELLWVQEDCPYAIQMACVLKVDNE